MTSVRPLAMPAALFLAWLVLSFPGGLTVFDLLAGAAAGGAGFLIRKRRPEPAPTPGTRPGRSYDDSPEGTGVAAVAALLEAMAADLAATRLVVWRLDRAGDTLAPVHLSDGPAPRSTSASGNPLTWAIDQGGPIRLDPAPPWARGDAVAAPVDGITVLTAEGAAHSDSDIERVARAARALAPVLALADHETAAAAATARLDRVVDLLQAVPADADPARMPHSLARGGMTLMGGAGALVASWTGQAGEVLVVDGEGGGPVPGTEFGVLDGDLAHAARVGAAVYRGPGGERPALATDAERWARPRPAHRVVLPLVDPGGATRGLLAVWGDAPPEGQGVELLTALGPLLALQLGQARDLVRYRDQATADPLTGLANRASLETRMEEEKRRFERYRRPVALLVVDLDHFKAVNDTHGHDAGDAVLREMGAVLRASIRDVDFPARLGGEELVVLLPETMRTAAMDVAERVRAAIEVARVALGDGTTVNVTASIGVSACPEIVEDPQALFASADRALYVSKGRGRNRVTAADREAVR